MLSQLLLRYREKIPPSISIFLLLIALSILRSRRSKKNALSYKEIPSAPSRLPIFGHLFSLGKTPVFKFMEWHKQLGPLYRVDFGARSLILVGDPAAAQAIFVNEGDGTSSRRSGTYSSEIYGRGGRGLIIAPIGKQWKAARKMALHVLSPKIVQAYEAAIRTEMQVAAQKLNDISECDGNDGVNPIKVFELASMNIILSTCFAVNRLESTDDPLFRTMNEFLVNHMKFSGQRGDITAMFPFLRWVEFFLSHSQKRDKFVKEYRDAPIMELVRLARMSDNASLTKTLDEVKDQLEFDEWDIVILLSDLMVAGSDTTSTTLTWMLAILVRYPEVQKKIQEEIDTFKRAHVGLLPTFEDREMLPYTISVQKECMRFRPTTSFGVPHQTTRDVVWNGYLIPKGTSIAANMYAIHRNADRYNKPDEFIPERFMDNTKSMMASGNGRFENRDHFNFGWGRRICPGMHLAETEIFDAFIAVFSEYDVKPQVDSQGNAVYPVIRTGKLGGVVVPPDPFKVRVLPRVASS